MHVSVPKALISIMQGFQTKLVLNVCQCSKGTHQYHARVSSNISTQYMSVFQRHSSVTCKGFKQYQYSMYVSVPKALISNMLGFQTLLLLNVCQCCKGTHQYHARVSNYISTQCMSVFQRHSLVPCKCFKQSQYSMYVSVPKALISTMQGFKQYQYSMYGSVPKALISTMQVFLNNISTQCMSVFQRALISTMQGVSNNIITQCKSMFAKSTHQYHCKGFKQYQYSMYVSVPKGDLVSNMQGFQTILVLNVCQYSKRTHQHHARLSNNISTQCMSVFQSHSSVTCKGFSNNISTQCMSEFQRHSLVNMLGFQPILVLNVWSVFPKALVSIMQGFQTKLVLNVCQCSKGTHQYHARVSSNISTQYMSVFQRHSSVTCKGFQTILVLNVCQCSKGTHQ